MQEFPVGGNVRHRLPVMSVTDIAFRIDDTVQGHAAQLEKIDFLPVRPRHQMILIGQADERDLFVLPVLSEHAWRIGSYGQDLCSAPLEFVVSVPQARQLRAAVRSHETAQERKQDGLAPKIG